MRVTIPAEKQADWIPLSRQLVHSVADLFEHYTRERALDGADDDFSKLLAAAAKLEAFSRHDGGLDEHALWHELRNLVGTILGYTELIIEDSDYPAALEEPLRQIGKLCNNVLRSDSSTPVHSRSKARRSTLTSQRGTILIVDDQASSREILMRYLRQDQHEVLEAAGGKQMFEALNSNDVDVILLDLILPEMDGDELLQSLKSDDRLRAIPVIVVSGNKDVDRVIRCIEAGAEDYLFKPFNPTLLRARISAGVERKRWHDKEKLYRNELERNQRFIRKVFGRYLSEEIVTNLLESPEGLDLGGVSRKVTVMMADITGFTTIAERLPPERVVRLLNNYLGTMSDIIIKYNGTVDEFIGDAILAIFGAPISRVDDTDRAVRCALEMQAAMGEINQRNRREHLPEIEMGVSINTGQVVAGNIGSEKRAKYGVVGHTVNQTARIEERCGPGTILISESTLKDCKAILSIGNSKTINAKGILKAIKIFELTGIAPDQISPSSLDNAIHDDDTAG